VGLAFRAALFNIGGRGQMLMAGAAAGWVGYQFEMPWPIHVTLAILVGMAAGALWGGLVGLLKARTGAHEVIVTIMLNYVAFYLVFYALSEQNLLQAPGSANPKSLPMKESVVLPKLFGDRYNLHLGFLLALIAVAVVWWILNRSSLGFRIRAVGQKTGLITSWGGGAFGFMRSLALVGPLTVPQIAAMRPTSRQRMQRLADELAAAGLVELVDNPKHRRSKLVRLTRKGETRYRAMSARFLALASTMGEDLRDAEIRKAAGILRRLSEEVKAGSER